MRMCRPQLGLPARRLARVACAALVLLAASDCKAWAQDAAPPVPATALPVSWTVDWSTGIVSGSVELPAHVAADESFTLLRARGSEPPALRIEKGILRFEAPAGDLRGLLTPQTRSIAIRQGEPESGRDYRIELPAPVLAGAAVEGEAPGPAITLRLEGALPGFQIVHAALAPVEPSASQALPVEKPIASTGTGYPRIIGVEHSGDISRVTVLFASGSAEAAVDHFLAAVNPDGSRTASLRLKQRGESVERRASVALPACPLPVDAASEVPAVELLPLADARARLQAAGLVAIVCDVATLQPIVGASDEMIVARQGVPARSRCRAGEVVLLGVSLSDVGPIVEAATGSPGLIEINEDQGFVAVAGPSFELGGGLAAATPSANSSVANAVLLPEAAFEQTPEDAPDGVGADDSSAPIDGVTQLAIGADPGIDLVPGRPAEASLKAALLKLLVSADAVSSRAGAAVELLEKKLKQAIEAAEPSLREAALRDPAARSLPVHDLFVATATALDVEIGDTKLRQAEADWQTFAVNRQAPADIDADRDERLADDAAAWFLSWLVRADLFDPATRLRVVADGSGGAVAVVSERPVSPDWQKNANLPGRLAELIAALLKSQGQQPSTTVIDPPRPQPAQIADEEADDEIVIPEGPQRVARAELPDRVRVPADLIERSVPNALARLAELGLNVARQGKLFRQDRLVSTKPAGGAWTTPETAVELRVERRVPGVTEWKLADALAELREKELRPSFAGAAAEFRNGDVVVEQRPPAFEYVPRNSEVALTVKRPVPKLLELAAKEATELIARQGFALRAPDDALPTDVIVEQSPSPFELAAPGERVTLVRLETHVPDLQGASLAEAKTLLEAKRLLDARKLPFEVIDPVSAFRDAKVLRQRPAAGERIDRQKQVVELAVVVPVPKFTVSTSLQDAQAAVQVRSLAVADLSRRARPSDVVLEVSVANRNARQYRVEGVIYVTPGEALRLKVGRKVPSVAGMKWADGLARIAATGFETSTPLGAGTHVESTSPEGNAPLDVDQKVVVYAGVQVPSVAGDPFDQALRKLRQAGLRGASAGVREVETADPNLVNQRFVDRSPDAQTPRSGKIVRVNSQTTVSLQTILYVQELVTVPPLVDLSPDEAERKLADNKLRMKQTIVARITGDRALDGRTTAVSQNPPAGRRVEPQSTVLVQFARWTYADPTLTTYGVFPAEQRLSAGGGKQWLYWKCILSGDRSTLAVELRLPALDPARVTGKLTDDRYAEEGERYFTYELTGLKDRAIEAIRIPQDGEGRGQILIDGVWFYSGPNRPKFMFSTEPPTF